MAKTQQPKKPDPRSLGEVMRLLDVVWTAAKASGDNDRMVTVDAIIHFFGDIIEKQHLPLGTILAPPPHMRGRPQ